jgi:uncharacterized iron-regulated membrane protein
MKPLRTVIFWLHLAAGVVAGLIILVMSATGAVLAFKPQILNRIDHGVRFVEPTGAPRLSPSQLLAAARSSRSDLQPTSIVFDRDPTSSVALSLGREETIYVNPYTGAVLGEGSATAQRFFRSTEDWHRWLSVTGENRAAARSAVGAANLAFLGLAISGLFIWWPHTWLPQHMKAILFFRRTSTGRARNFNWHNVIGFWCAPVLIILTATGVVMSYPWANRLVYQLAGSPLPAVRDGGGRGGPQQAVRAEQRGRGNTDRNVRGRGGQGRAEDERPARAAVALLDNLDQLWARAEQQLPTWQTVTMRLPDRPGAPASFTMSDAQYWNSFARSQLTLDAATADVIRWEPYAGTSRGQKWRGWVRFGHTGELGGILGQFLAGIASLGGVALVYTGLALALRRLIGWRLWRRFAARPAAPTVPASAAAAGYSREREAFLDVSAVETSTTGGDA